jgi:hypothetical protein
MQILMVEGYIQYYSFEELKDFLEIGRRGKNLMQHITWLMITKTRAEEAVVGQLKYLIEGDFHVRSTWAQ